MKQTLCVKYFLSFPKKTCHQRKLRQTKCILFNFSMIKLTKTPILPNFHVPSVFFCMTVNFMTQKLKSKHSGDRFFWGNERKYFTHIPGLELKKLSTKLDKESMSRLSHFWLKDIMDEAKMKNGSLSNRAQSHPLIKFCSKLKIGYYHSIY